MKKNKVRVQEKVDGGYEVQAPFSHEFNTDVKTLPVHFDGEAWHFPAWALNKLTELLKIHFGWVGQVQGVPRKLRVKPESERKGEAKRARAAISRSDAQWKSVVVIRR